eukprot:g791.t1
MPTVILATAGYDHTIRFWEAPTGMCYRTVQYTDSQINRLEITPDKAFLAACGNSHVRLYEINTNNPQPVTSYDGHTSNVTAVGFQKDGKWMFTGSEDGTIKVWDLRASGCQRNYDSGVAINDVVLHPNQAELVSGDQNGGVRTWDLRANSCISELVPDGEGITAVRSVSVAADASCVVAANNKGTCFVWRPKSSKEYVPIRKFQAHDTYVLRCRLSPDVSCLATAAADKTVKLWNVQDFTSKQPLKPAKQLVDHTRWVWDCVFSADSSYLVTGSSDHTARLWSIGDGEPIRHYTGHHKAVVCVALNDTNLQ